MKKLLIQVIVAAAAALSSTGAYALTDVPYITTSTAKKNWLLLDYRPNQDTIIEATVAIPAEVLSQKKHHAVFCARGTSSSDNTFTSFFFFNSPKTQFRWDYGKSTGNVYGTVAADTPYVITYNIASATPGKRCFSVATGAVTNRYADCTPLSNWRTANKLILFASYTGPTNVPPTAVDNYATFRVYGVRIWDGAQTDDKLLFDLRPCIDGNGVYCLRDAKNPNHAPYYGDGGNSFDGSMYELKVSVEDFGSCVPHVSLTGIDVPDVTSVKFEFAPTANGPWTAFATVNSPEGGVAAADYEDAVVSVPVYYRATVNRANVDASSSIPLPAVSFTRFHRLERDPADEKGGLVQGYSKMSDRCTNAFDGEPETFPVVDPMEIGIDFGEEGAYVACVRALPRYDNTGRMNGARLYAADAADLSDAVAVSPGLSCSGKYTKEEAQAGLVPFSVVYAQDTPVFHRFYYLYQAGWYGNVAEMQLYGWTLQDQKQSGELIPPSSFSAKRGSEAGSIVVSWIDGENVETLELQRRVVGTEEWLTVASGLTGSTYTDKGLVVDRTYEYQLVAQGNGKTLTVAVESPVYIYTAGGGTGLRGVIWGPIASAECRNSQAKQCTYHEFRTDAAIDFNREISAEVLYSSTNLTSGLVIWRGKLIVPTDGDYTIGIEVGAYDGYVLTVGETELGNRYTGKEAERTAAVVALKAGEHPIEVQWASRAAGGIRKCRLFWALEGKISEETIPVSQLKPAADSELPVYFKDGLNFALPISYGMYDGGWGISGVDSDDSTKLPSFDGPFADGACQIRARSNRTQSWTMSVFGRPVKGPFRAELTVRKGESDSGCYPGVYITGSSPIKQMIGFVVRPDGGVHLYASGSSNMNVWDGVTVGKSKGNSTQTETNLRVTRDAEGTLRFFCRNEVTGNKWVECYTYVGGTNCVVTESGELKTGLCTMADKALYVGFGGNNTKSVAHDLKIQEGLQGLIMFVR